jgi:hypothetical protein
MRTSLGLLPLCLVVLASFPSAAQDKQKPKPKPGPVYTDPAQAGLDFLIQGEYRGEDAGSMTGLIGAQVIALGDGNFDVNLLPNGLPGEGWGGKVKIPAKARTVSGKTTVSGKGIDGTITIGAMSVTMPKGRFILKRVVRRSHSLGEEPPPGALVLFDGSGADAWRNGKLAMRKLLNCGAVSKREFKDFLLHVEFLLPFMPHSRGQARAHSGVLLQNRYELQILDSFGLKGVDTDCGAFVGEAAPSIPMCYPPLQWQTFDVEFKAARFQDGKKTASAIVTVRHNGVTIHANRALKKSSAGGQKEADAPGPLDLQDHGDPVYFRNIWVVEKK